MNTLSKDWLTQGLIDYEYKKYILLAYLQKVKKRFAAICLYPQLSDLIFHYQNLQDLKQNKELLFENFPKEISKADFDKLKLEYKNIIENDELMKEMEEIIAFAMPEIENTMREGKEIYEYVEKNLEISPVGITPLRFDEGYFFIQERNKRELQIFEYRLTIFDNANEKFRAIQTFFLESIRKDLGITLENIKLDLIRRYAKMPNPATYFILSHTPVPLQETLLPVAKRLLVRYVSKFWMSKWVIGWIKIVGEWVEGETNAPMTKNSH